MYANNDNLGLVLLYSDHMGLEPLKQYADYASPHKPYGVATTVILDEWFNPGEFVLNPYKVSSVCKALLDAGIVEDTGRRTFQGYYEDLPIVTLKKVQPVTYRAVDRSICMQCGKTASNVIECITCKAAWYCSVDCEKEAWESHHVQLCSLLKVYGK